MAAKSSVRSATVALYDEAWRSHRHDRPGIRVRFYRGRSTARDYYPSAGLLRFMMCLAWSHWFSAFEMYGKQRISIRP